MEQFKIGDRVIVKSMGGRNIRGKKGTIFKLGNIGYAVEFDQHIDYGHSCGNSAGPQGKYGYCWNCEENEIELIESIITEPQYEIY